MPKHGMDVTTFVGKLLEESDVDLLGEGVRILAQVLKEAEVSTQIGAGPTNAPSPALPIALATPPGPGGTRPILRPTPACPLVPLCTRLLGRV